MSIYVHIPISCLPTVRFPYHKSTHLIADTESELHEFAQKIGLKRSWFQNKKTPHYDLTESKYHKAIANGAILLNRKDFVTKMKIIRHNYHNCCSQSPYQICCII